MTTKTTQKAAIDWAMSLDIFNGKEELAKAILKMYVEKLPVAKNNIIANRDDTLKLQHVIHELTGASYYCGVPKIKATISQIDNVLKLKQHNNLDDLLDQLLVNIDEVIDNFRFDD